MGRSRYRLIIAAALVLTSAGYQGSALAQETGFGDFGAVNGATGAIGYIGGTSFELTDANNSEASSGFANTLQSVTNFSVSFTYTELQGSTGTSQADGITFVLQNDSRGVTALGGTGGSLGYGAGGGGLIGSSVAIELNAYSGQIIGTSLGVNGSVNANFLPTTPLDFTAHNPVGVTLSYDGSTLTEKLTDATAGTSYTRFWTVNIPAMVGSNTARIGFTGGTGGFNAVQTVSNFSFQPGTGTSPTPAIFKPIAVTGFTQDMIVESTAPATQAGARAAATANLDSGATNTGGDTWFQKGWDPAAPNAGLPQSGVPFFAENDSTHSFSLASATGNNAVLMSSTTGTATLSLQSPQAYSKLSFLDASGNGPNGFNVVVHHANGAPDESFTGLSVPDWFNNNSNALTVNGRAGLGSGSFDNINGNNPRMYDQDITLADTVDPVTGIDISYASGTGNTSILAVSGVAVVPEPGTVVALMGGMGVCFLFRRSSRSRMG